MKKFLKNRKYVLFLALFFSIVIPIVLVTTGCPLSKSSLIPHYSLSISFENSPNFDSETKTLQFDVTAAQKEETTITGEIGNKGDTTFTINSLILEDTINYKLNSTNLPLKLEPGETLNFSLSFAPQTSGNQNTILTINYTTDKEKSETITLMGEGNYAPTAQFVIEVSGATNYPGVNGFYIKDENTFNLHPVYKKSGSSDYYIYFFAPDGYFWGINPTFDESYPSYGETANGPICYIGALNANTAYPPETEEASNSVWVENYINTPQITIRTGITRDTTNQILSANYRYSDSENDSESGTTFKWYKSDTIDGTYTELSGVTGNEYTLNLGTDEGKYFKLEVTVADERGITGEPIVSDPYYVEPAQLLTAD